MIMYAAFFASIVLIHLYFSPLKWLAASLYSLGFITVTILQAKHWLDVVYCFSIFSLLGLISLVTDLFRDKEKGQESLLQKYQEEADLYKNRFDTMVMEYKKKEEKKDFELQEHISTLDLQKERICKLEDVIRHQEKKCMELSKKIHSQLEELGVKKEDRETFQLFCQNLAKNINHKGSKSSGAKVPLVAFRKYTKAKNKIQLSDLAKNLKG